MSAATETAAAATDPAATRLAAFRTGEDPNGDRRPDDIQERTSPQAPSPIESRPAGAAPDPAAPDHDAEPVVFQDNKRKAIAARARAARAATPAPARFDEAALPEGVRIDADDDDPHALDDVGRPEVDARQPAARQPAPRDPAPAQDGRFTLKVFKNEFAVSREELLRYADVSAEEAADFDDARLVKLAQKNLAADQLLEEAKQARTASRPAARDDALDQGRDQQRTDAEPRSDQAGGLNQKTDRELMELAQLGDTDEALDASRLLTQRTMARASAEQQMASLDRLVDQAIEGFAADPKNADIVGDEVASGAHRAMLQAEIANELRPLLTDDQFRRIATDPDLARKAYKAAYVDGHKVRSPDQMFAAAAAKVRTSFGRRSTTDTDPRRQPPAADAASERDAAKRGLVRQPTRSDTVQAQSPAQGRGQRANPSDVIRKTFGSRMNRG